MLQLESTTKQIPPHSKLWGCEQLRTATKRHEIFSYMMSLPAMSFGDRFCFSRKGGTGGGELLYSKGANSMAVSGLGCRNDWLASGGPFLSFLT